MSSAALVALASPAFALSDRYDESYSCTGTGAECMQQRLQIDGDSPCRLRRSLCGRDRQRERRHGQQCDKTRAHSIYSLGRCCSARAVDGGTLPRSRM